MKKENSVKIIAKFEENFPTKEQVIISVPVDTKGWDFTAYFEEKLEELSTELWEDGYSFAIYKVKELIRDLESRTTEDNELAILQKMLANLK